MPRLESLPEILPPLPRDDSYRRELPAAAALDWLRLGWADFRTQPGLSLAYGLGVFAVSALVVRAIFALGAGHILFPALAAFLIGGPVLAIGLYEKSRRIEAGEPIDLRAMLMVRPRSGGQVVYLGLALCLVALVWMRAAVLIYALFYGMNPFPGFDDIVQTLLTTPDGWALIVVGSAVGGLFAAFGFATGVFAAPILLAERSDALTAMGTSMAMVWHNRPVMIAWGAIVVAVTALGLATGLIGLIIAFPVLGHASWHAYRAVRQPHHVEG